MSYTRIPEVVYYNIFFCVWVHFWFWCYTQLFSGINTALLVGLGRQIARNGTQVYHMKSKCLICCIITLASVTYILITRNLWPHFPFPLFPHSNEYWIISLSRYFIMCSAFNDKKDKGMQGFHSQRFKFRNDFLSSDLFIQWSTGPTSKIKHLGMMYVLRKFTILILYVNF